METMSCRRRAALTQAKERNAHILLFHHDPVDQVPQALVRVLLRRLGVLVVLQAELPQETLRVEGLFPERDGPIGLCGRIELVEQDEEGSRHRQRGRERLEVRVVVWRGGREGAQGRGRVGSLGDDVAKWLRRRERLDDGIVEAAIAEVDEADTAERHTHKHKVSPCTDRASVRRATSFAPLLRPSAGMDALTAPWEGSESRTRRLTGRCL